MAFEQIYLSSGKCNWKLVNGLSAAPIRVPKSFGLGKTLNDLFSICCLWNELKIKSTAMAGERVLDRFDSFDLGKQNTTHIFRLSTFASSRHNYTLIVLANILQRSMKSPGALAAATAASDFMRFLAYFTNLPRSARSRKRIKKMSTGKSAESGWAPSHVFQTQTASSILWLSMTGPLSGGYEIMMQ